VYVILLQSFERRKEKKTGRSFHRNRFNLIFVQRIGSTIFWRYFCCRKTFE